MDAIKKLLAGLLLALVVQSGIAQQLTFLGNTALYNTGAGAIPTLGGFIEPNQSISVTTQTYPISSGQSVRLIYTTDNWATSHSVPLSFDYNTANNTQWFATLGPFPPNTDVLFYLQASTTNGINLYDNNGSQNYGFISRFEPAASKGAILQWFATPYSVIMQDLPLVVNAGYGALYLPPPEKAGGGGFSVGYNPFNRFDLGGRYEAGSLPTQYGTAEQLQHLILMAHRLGLKVYVDTVLNHNDNRASTAIDSYPNLIPEDFHIFSSTDTENNEINFNQNDPFTLNMLNGDLAGLADIAHEDGNLTETGPFNLPSWASFDSWGKPSFIRQPLDPQLYPGGTPYAENVRQYLIRWCQWMISTIGVDGFRIDAVRETPPAFFNRVNSQAGYWVNGGSLLPALYGNRPDLFVFGEDDNTNNYESREYLKTGMDLLDFNLFNNIGSVFNSNGYGSLGNSLANGYGIDSATSLGFAHGGLAPDLGVSFVQSHDYGPPTSNNLAYAFTLTSPKPTIVYFDGNNLDPFNYSQFPKPGRYDAIGYQDSIITTLTDARSRFGRGDLVNKYVSDSLYIFERRDNGTGLMLVGMNNRGDSTALSATVQTDFAPGTVLRDHTGQEPDLTVGTGGTVQVTVPSNGSSLSPNNGTGYVVYTPIAPNIVSAPTVIDGTTPVQPATVAVPAGSYGAAGSYSAYTLHTGSLSLQVRTDTGATAFLKVDDGVQLPGTHVATNTPEGLTDGYIQLGKAGSLFYARNLNISGLEDGLHLFNVRIFANTGSGPGIYRDVPIFAFVQRSDADAVDGDLSGLGQPLVTQTNAPTSQANRLDEMFVSNDADWIYIGLAGQVDPSLQYLNGVVTFIQSNLGSGQGFSNFGAINDDSGPAARLLSNSAIIGPGGFSADFGLSSVGQSTLDSSFGLPCLGAAVTPTPVGAMAGLFHLDPSHPAAISGVPVKIAWKPRSSPFGPTTGFEAAIPISSLYPNGVSPGTTMGLLSGITTTGVSGQTLTAHDPSRGALGGFPVPYGYVLNQFLPPQPGLTADPGTVSVGTSRYATYQLKFADFNSGLSLQYKPVVGLRAPGNYMSSVGIYNHTGHDISGPIKLIIHLGAPGITVLQQTGLDYTQPNSVVIQIPPTVIKAGQYYVEKINFVSPGGRPNPSYAVAVGSGIP